jgi:hypothetical protein
MINPWIVKAEATFRKKADFLGMLLQTMFFFALFLHELIAPNMSF